MSEQIKVPFTPEQVKNLNEYQVSGAMHEFNCGHPNHPKKGKRSRLKMLVAAPQGWFCPGCGQFTQFWAWPFMADGELVKKHKDFIKDIIFKRKKKNAKALTLAEFLANKK